MKLVTVIGARPQFIKAAVVSRCIRDSYPDAIRELIVHTGQHYDANMSDIFFQQMDIPKPDYSLNISGLNHGAMTGQMLEKIEETLLNEKPDCVLVYGDTNSTLAGALAAKKLHIPLAHVEAGLRSYNMKMPEEINRILTDRISDFLFCPTDQAVANLKKEAYGQLDVVVIKSGDVMQDAAIFYAQRDVAIPVEVNPGFVLATIHRAENTDDPKRLQSIFSALTQIAASRQVVLPLHPRTKALLEKHQITFDQSRISLIEPVGYLEMIALLKQCGFVMTDSGGLQKEAFFFKKMCLTLRDETEWVELVSNGFNFIVGSDKDRILSGVEQVLHGQPDFTVDLYGGGKAGGVIVKELLNKIGG